MRQRGWLAFLVASASLSSGISIRATSSALTFEQRVTAQRAIEQVYYAHQEGATLPFDEAVPPELIERKVLDYLRQSAALEHRWHQPINATMLRQEAARMARSTRMPERLAEIYAALDNDPVLILECLVRPALASRLARARFDSDERLRAAAPEEGATASGKSWDEWWAESAPSFDTALVATVANAADVVPPIRWAPLAAQSLSSACPLNETWDTAGAVAPEGLRVFHTAVWTGSRMIVWGGESDGSSLNTGVQYDPVTDTQAPISTADAPAGRSGHGAVWTGSRMIVWGGSGGGSFLTSGGSYDPVGDTWSGISTTEAPSGRFGFTTVWTGTRMLIWGGETSSAIQNTGAMYNPQNDMWSAISTTQAPTARKYHSAVWTGSRMIVWGGASGPDEFSTGGSFNPQSNSWTDVSTVDAPPPRMRHTAVWTDGRMIVWGGHSGGPLNSGGLYDPSLDSWTATPLVDAPAPRSGHTAVVANNGHMIVWGGNTLGVPEAGGRFDPVANSWAPTSTLGAPSGRNGHTAVWTGSRMIIWGGSGTELYGRYDPAADTWMTSPYVPLSTSMAVWTGNLMIIGVSRFDPVLDLWTRASTLGVPSGFGSRPMVWTGQRVLDWKGGYDPIADTWSIHSTVNAPPDGPIVLWTGSVMIVWGANAGGGGRYDPGSDTWAPISGVGEPPGGVQNAGVWSGSQMVVWGSLGDQLDAIVNYGGRYDPETDTWSPMSTTNHPLPTTRFRAAWAGDRMVVYGGYYRYCSSPPQEPCQCCYAHDWYRSYPTTGGSYDPATDTWSQFTGFGGREQMSVASTGTEAVFWGGRTCSDFVCASFRNDGFRYNPQTGVTTLLSTVNAPSPRWGAPMVWTRYELILWGGQRDGPLRDGGRYGISLPPGPDSDSDGFDSSCDCDETRSSVHPGAAQVCGDGVNNNCTDLSWPSLNGTNEADDDGDGLTECAGDCDDALASVGPGAPQICDGINNDCNASGWPTPPANEADQDVDGFRICAGDCVDTQADVWPGAPQLCGDGLNNDCGHPGWPSLTGTNESDVDSDGVSPCSGDCDDTRSSVHPGAPQTCGDGLNNDCSDPAWPSLNGTNERDDDLDGFAECTGDCDDARGSVSPGAPQLCDGLNNDCNAVDWPTPPADEVDSDGDGVRPCAGDCDNNQWSIWPGAFELNDGIDNQCPGDAGFGIIDELEGETGFPYGFDTATICWLRQPLAASYRVARGEDPTLSSGLACAAPVTFLCYTDAATPILGGIFYYLVRAESPYAGSWGRSSSGTETVVMCGGG